MTRARHRKFWVFASSGNGGAVILKMPQDGPKEWEYFQARRLAETLPAGAALKFSKRFPSQKKVFDSVCNLNRVPIVSVRIRQIIDVMAPGDCEFLPITLLDHKGKVASREHFLLNILRVEDVIDMEQSQFDRHPFKEDQIYSIELLRLKADVVPPDAHIFHPRTMMDLHLIDEEIHDAFMREGITGAQLFPAEGWDGVTL